MTNEEAKAYAKEIIDFNLNDKTQAFCEMALKALNQITWTSINEKPPETGERVLVLFNDGFIMIGSYLDYEDGTPITWILDGQEDYNININNIIAWMSTPESYKEN